MKKYLFLFLILFAFSRLWGQNITDYDYPIKPGSSEWKKFKSTQEMVDACQIPESVLKKLNTKDLLQVCLKYPLLREYTASNSPYEGLKNIIGVFNGLNEFMNRQDCHKFLFEHYKNQNINSIQSITNKGSYTFDICALELLLCQKQLMERFNKEELTEVLNTIMKKYEDKAKYAEYFGFYGKMTTAFVGNKFKETLDNTNIEKDVKKRLFIEKMLIADFDIIDKIIAELQSYIVTKRK